MLLVRGVAVAPAGWILLEMRRRFGVYSIALIPLGYFSFVFAGKCYVSVRVSLHVRVRA